MELWPNKGQNAAADAPVLPTGVIASSTRRPPSYPLRSALQAPGFHAPKVGSSVSPTVCFQLTAPVACDPS